MNRRYLWRFVTVAALATIGLGAVGWVVMSLWNWLAPATFGGHVIGFWQALGLFVLARILVGGLRRGGHGRGPWRRRVSERWEAMSDEERAGFQHRFGGRCGGPRVDKAGGLPA
jgi:hypothetical protein